MSRTTIRVMGVVLACTVLAAGAYIVINRPAPATRTAGEIDAVAQECREGLAPLVDAGLFAGAGEPGAPQRALAAYVKWTWLPPLQWQGARADVALIVVYGSGFHKCYALDALGNVLGTRSRQNEAWSTRWLRRADDAGRFAVTVHERDPALRDGKAAPVRTLAADAGAGEISSLQLTGREAGERAAVARFGFDAASGLLDLRIGAEERAEIGSDGRVVRSMQRPCFDPDAPCEEPWEETVYTYDDAGNPVRRQTELDGDRLTEDLVAVTNDRGDWIELRLQGQPDAGTILRRALVYRD